jgi:hypothetical protein
VAPSGGLYVTRKVSTLLHIIGILLCPPLWVAGLYLGFATTADQCAYDTTFTCTYGSIDRSSSHQRSPVAFVLLFAWGAWRLMRRKRQTSAGASPP